MSGLHKFIKDTEGNGRGKVHWGNSNQNGLPFRGEQAPLLRQAEFEDRTVSVADAHVGIFGVGVTEKIVHPDYGEVRPRSDYQEIMDRAANGWYTILFVDRKFDKKIPGLIYVEWLSWYLEDGTDAMAPGT